MTLILPDSSQFEIAPEEEQGSLVLKINNASLPGIYHITYRGEEIDRFAVNLNPKESDLKAIDSDQIASSLGADKINIVDNNTELASFISQLRFGKELWHIFLWIALILLALEMILSRGNTAEEN